MPLSKCSLAIPLPVVACRPTQNRLVPSRAAMRRNALAHRPCCPAQSNSSSVSVRTRRAPHSGLHIAAAAALQVPVTAPDPEPAEASQAASANLWPALRLASRVLRPDAWLLGILLVTLVLTIATTLAFPLQIGALFDCVREAVSSPGGSAAAAGPPSLPFQIPGLSAVASAPPTFHRVLVGLVGCLVLSTIGNAAIAVLSPLLAERFAVRLKDRLMTALLAKEQTFFDTNAKGDLISRLTLDVSVLQSTLSDYLGQRGFRSAFEVAGCLALLTWRQPVLALVALLVTPVLSRLLRTVVVRSTSISTQRQQAAADAMQFASERLRHVQTVQVFEQQGREAEAFGALSEGGYRLATKYAGFQGVVEGAGRMAINVGTLALLGVGGWLVINGKTSVGTVLAAQVQCLFLSVGLSSVAASLGELGKAVGALERIAALAESTSTATIPSSSSSSPAVDVLSSQAGTSSTATAVDGTDAEPVASVSGRVEFSDVWFRYPGVEAWALQGFSLTIEPGSTVALVGPSGGGKSTVAALLLGMYKPQRGSILIDGRPMSDPEYLQQIRPQMAAVLQQPMLMQASVADLIRYGCPQASMQQVVEAAVAASADFFIRQLPKGYDTDVGERGHSLSGGQKQRLAIARALITQPKILVLDEITSALDVESEIVIDTTLKTSLPGCTKLMVAHRLSTVRQADSIAVVSAGRVAEQGTHEELSTRVGGAYWRLLQSAQLGVDGWHQLPEVTAAH